jgi:hypothetical protein
MSALIDARDHMLQQADTDVSEARRALWKLLAEEINDYLAREEHASEDGPGLFGEGS